LQGGAGDCVPTPRSRGLRSRKYTDAVKLRDRLLAKKSRGEIAGGAPDRVTIGDLLDDMLKYSGADEDTKKIYSYVIEANIRPYFGDLKAARLTTEKLWEYRKDRIRKAAVEHSTVNRETSVLRIAYNFGRKKSPPTVLHVPHFPMVKETNIRQGFMKDTEYKKLVAELPTELKPLFVVAYATGVRKGELLAVRWDQVDFGYEEILLYKGETKTDDARVLPFLTEDMATYLKAAKAERDANYPQCPWVFSRRGEQIKDFRESWCPRSSIPWI